jgi:hypothetical protein
MIEYKTKNNMKNLKKILFMIPLAGLLLAACDSWTEVENKEIDHIGGRNTDGNSDQYYKDLRTWKATAKDYGRPVYFGWFSNWSPIGAARKGYLNSLPDSVDMISLWSEPFGLTREKLVDKENFQKKKGGKLFVCYILHDIGKGITPTSVAEKVQAENPNADASELQRLTRKAQDKYWGFTSGVKGSEDHIAAIKKYARALCDSIIANAYDGLDIDWEPNGAADGDGSLKNSYDPGKYLHVLIEALSEYLGPKSKLAADGKYRYLLVDGELWNVSKESGPYFDYYISQAYGSAYLDNRVSQGRNAFGEYYDPRKHIFTENFESYWSTGGALLKQAAYNHSSGPKGGVGAYRLDNDYDNTPDYKYTRQAIQIMHKAYKDYMDSKKGESKANGSN